MTSVAQARKTSKATQTAPKPPPNHPPHKTVATGAPKRPTVAELRAELLGNLAELGEEALHLAIESDSGRDWTLVQLLGDVHRVATAAGKRGDQARRVAETRLMQLDLLEDVLGLVERGDAVMVEQVWDPRQQMNGKETGYFGVRWTRTGPAQREMERTRAALTKADMDVTNAEYEKACREGKTGEFFERVNRAGGAPGSKIDAEAVAREAARQTDAVLATK